MASTASVAGNVAKFRFSTDDFSERERLTAWREIFGRTVCRLDIEPLAGPRFQAESTVYALPGIGVLSGSCSGVDLTHSRELIVDDDLSFMTGSMRSWTASQLGRSPTLGPGDGVLMSNAEVGSMLLPAAQHFVTFKVPVSAIAPFVPDVGALIARRIPRETEALRLLVRYLDVLQNEGTLKSAELRRLAVTHVYDLFALALGTTRDAGEVANGRGLRAARLLAIKSDIDTRLGESDLSVNAIAALRADAFRARRHHVFGISAGTTARSRPSHAGKSPLRRPHDHRHRLRGRLQRFVLFQPKFPPPLWLRSVGCASCNAALIA
jgi:hypothetical protein